uniref:C2H2-type domain-containing protein n=1 Tax=Kryptolebias marmoratus TaxID=37003 RepID=A0A3Q3B4P4_KRYMA
MHNQKEIKKGEEITSVVSRAKDFSPDLDWFGPDDSNSQRAGFISAEKTHFSQDQDCVSPIVTKDRICDNTDNVNDRDAAIHAGSTSEANCSSMHVPSSIEMKISPTEKMAPNCPALNDTSDSLTNDSNEKNKSVSSNPESSSKLNASGTNTDACQEMESPPEMKTLNFSPNHSGDHSVTSNSLSTNIKDITPSEMNQKDSENESSKSSLEIQMESSSSAEKKTVQYQCSECDKSFTDGLLLISHLEDHGREEQEKKQNICSMCGKMCSSQGNLEKHMRIHVINQKFSCAHCSKVFPTMSDLEKHKTSHDPNKPFFCKLCQQRFWTRPELCDHYRREHADDVFYCQFCSKVYPVKKSDEDENEDSDSDSDSAPYFPCHVCGKTFPTSESLEDHQLCHLGEKPHECAECGKCFFHASQLQQHRRMHKSEFQCQTCGRGFVSLFALRTHKHTHGKSRQYRCSKCHLFFTGPTQLAEHMSTHREETLG